MINEGISKCKDLNFRTIIDQTGTYIYDASKVVAEFSKPLARMNLPLLTL